MENHWCIIPFTVKLKLNFLIRYITLFVLHRHDVVSFVWETLDVLFPIAWIKNGGSCRKIKCIFLKFIFMGPWSFFFILANNTPNRPVFLKIILRGLNGQQLRFDLKMNYFEHFPPELSPHQTENSKTR